MPIKNYTTQVDEMKTVGEIMGLLAAKGARAIRIDYDDKGRPSGVQFVVIVDQRPIPFKLPCNFAGVFRSILREYKDKWARQHAENNPQKREQARRVAWRIIKDWIASQMALIEAEQATLPQVFLPYAVTGNGTTVYEQFISQTKALPAAEGVEP